MELKSKFNVNDLLVRKYDKGSEELKMALEVLEIHSQTCYAGTQFFYQCRIIVLEKERETKIGIAWLSKEEREEKEKQPRAWTIRHGQSRQEGQLGWERYREDELQECPSEIQEQIQSK